MAIHPQTIPSRSAGRTRNEEYESATRGAIFTRLVRGHRSGVKEGVPRIFEDPRNQFKTENPVGRTLDTGRDNVRNRRFLRPLKDVNSHLGAYYPDPNQLTLYNGSLYGEDSRTPNPVQRQVGSFLVPSHDTKFPERNTLSHSRSPLPLFVEVNQNGRKTLRIFNVK